MIESPLIQEIVARTKHEVMHKAILQLLQKRFGSVPPEVATQLRSVLDEQKLDDLNIQAALCPDLDAFRAKLQA